MAESETVLPRNKKTDTSTKAAKSASPGDYGADSIKILEGLEAVRKRPAMYIGSSGPQGLHHLVYEVVDNSIDEALAGYCKYVEVTIHSDQSITITDDGRGIPTAAHPDRPDKSTVEVVMTVLHAGGKFNNDAYKFSGGLHGVGISVVNALSEWLEVEVKREGKVHRQRFERGIPAGPLSAIGETKKTGTSVRFRADEKVFETIEFHYDTLANRLRELAFLNRGITITIQDERAEGRSHQFRYDGGITEFVKSLNEGKEVVSPTPIYFHKAKQVMKQTLDGEKPEDVEVEVCIQYNSTFHENVYSFVNNINTIEGGTHMIGFRKALTRTLNDYARKNDLMKRLKENLSGEDLKEGLTAVLSLKISDPQFESQTKIKLGNTEMTGLVEQIVNDGLTEFLEENPKVAKKIIEKSVLAATARIEARKVREVIRKGALEISALPGKLSDCSEKDPARCELFIVEGDSAGGTARQGRDRHFQAILPIRGKILNVERARLDKILSNEEIRSLVTAMGIGIGDSQELEKLRYAKCVIMTDADVDGAHIRTLLLTFFFRQMRPLIERGHVYIAQPPLYKIKKGKMEQYLDRDEDRDRLLVELGVEEAGVTFRKFSTNGKKTATLDGTVEIRKSELKQLLEIIAGLETVDRTFLRKGTSLREVMAAQQEDASQRLPIGLFTREEQHHFAFTEAEYIRLADEEDKDAAPVRKEPAAAEKPIQSELALSATDEVEQDYMEAARKYTAHDLRAEAGQLQDLLKKLSKLGLDGAVYDVDPSEIYKLTNDRAPFIVDGEKSPKPVHTLRSVLEAVKDIGKKGISITRYKGLGEMNAQQLWETTMNPGTRRLMRVTLDVAESANHEAEEVFSTLMGDDALKRRQFIQRHAPEVRNLDI